MILRNTIYRDYVINEDTRSDSPWSDITEEGWVFHRNTSEYGRPDGHQNHIMDFWTRHGGLTWHYDGFNQETHDWFHRKDPKILGRWGAPDIQKYRKMIQGIDNEDDYRRWRHQVYGEDLHLHHFYQERPTTPEKETSTEDHGMAETRGGRRFHRPLNHPWI